MNLKYSFYLWHCCLNELQYILRMNSERVKGHVAFTVSLLISCEVNLPLEIKSP